MRDEILKGEVECGLGLHEFDQLRAFVYQLTGINLADSKRSMLVSRLNKRLRSTQCSDFSDYWKLIRSLPKDAPEIIEFINAVTTNTTHFFREPHHFEHVSTHVVPYIAKETVRGVPKLRVWHAGCSTGEEPYTLSMVLHEEIGDLHRWDIKQLATDIDTEALRRAEAGIYDAERLDSVPAPLQPKYFMRSKDRHHPKFKVKPVTAEWLTFRRLNLLESTWPLKASTQFDVIFCRNVMIYFDRVTQKELIRRFSAHLRPGGYLYVGHSESLAGISDGFRSVGRTGYQYEPSALQRAA